MTIKDFFGLKSVRIPNQDAEFVLKDDVIVFVLPYAGIDSPEDCCTVKELGEWKNSDTSELEKDIIAYDVSEDGLITLFY